MVFTELRVRDPRKLRWVRILAHTGESRGKFKFGDPFFRWLDDQILMIEDYMYTGIDLRGDLDIPLPPGAQWGDIGKKKNPKMVTCVFVFLMFFIFYM